MKKDTQKTSPDHVQAERKVLRLDRQTLRSLHGASRGPVLLEPSWRPSQCPTTCTI